MLLKRKWIGYYKLVRYKLGKYEVKCMKCPKKTFCLRTSSLLFEYCYRVNRLLLKDGLGGDSCYIAIDDSMTKGIITYTCY